jgi:toxin ParE1/3/4
VKAKPVIPRELAHRDVEQGIAHYLEEGSAPAALGFIDALGGRMPTSVATRPRARLGTGLS